MVERSGDSARSASTPGGSAHGAADEHTEEFANGDRYNGGWHSGKPHGYGTYTWADGSRYEGSWKNGLKHGHGSYLWPSGASYVGDWCDGLKQGVGTLDAPDGTHYHGSWYHDLKHGLGSKVFANQDKYEGLWKEGRHEGPGLYQWSNGNEYNGQWVAGRMQGRGTFVWTTGERYDGEWDAGKEEGRGKFTWTDRSWYFGYWKGGAKHGKGVWHPPDNDRKEKERAAADAARRASAAASGGPAGTGSPPLGGDDDAAGNHALGRQECLLREYNNGKLKREKVVQEESIPLELRLPKTPTPKRRMSQKVNKKKDGETIFKGHRSYELMVQLQLGIRCSVSAQQVEPERQITELDFTPKTKEGVKNVAFPRRGSSTTPPHAAPDFKWKDYSSTVFHKLRERFGIDASDYTLSICGDEALRELGSPGKSGSVFFLSHDDRFIIKTMRKHEMTHLRTMLPSYYKHVMSNPHTLMTKFFGLHRVKPSGGRKVRFIVMGNLFCTPLTLDRRFDLKGSTHGRFTPHSKPRESAILKDLDLDYVFRLEGDYRDKLMRQLAADCRLLEEMRVMDYSLLLGVHYRTPDGSFGRSPESPRGDGASTHQPIPEEDSEPADGDEAGSRPVAPLPLLPPQSVKDVARIRPERSETLRPVPGSAGATDMLAHAAGSRTIDFGGYMAATAVPKRVLQVPRSTKFDQGLLPDEPLDVVLFFGIIDILQEYNSTKKVEHAFKVSLQRQSNISACDPVTYSRRFQDFLGKIFD